MENILKEIMTYMSNVLSDMMEKTIILADIYCFYNWHIGVHVAVLAGNICTHTAQNLSITLEKILLENYDKCELVSYYLH